MLIYPEGTTTDGTIAQPFKGGSFEVAAQLGIPVIPIAIEYEDPNDHWTNTTLWRHYLHQFGKRSSRCRIGFGTPIVHEDAQKLKEETQKWVDEKLSSYRDIFDQI